MADRNGLGTKVALAGSTIAIVVSLITVGVRVGSLTTIVDVQSDEINRLRQSVELQRSDIQSLELYVRELHMTRGPVPPPPN